eukprot:CAMPEP_0172528280 /NCGR_PEP_ID=MMETSP1067-20121228/2718_1 /TAXON_ID=265564 ORGANISM="Thalassiosira punctigera, Strain Tpunct2005C2" /NCGR_SAMPLE_ID=MMETSP1067 /ASSEMBLY_ACC=CAM_ASM_000444 /LENGTH=560 /DNA_ID=CAMNT_0013312165 /DNA_START=144 /DNA_END=1827 /DNA_ORIENTATION=+
MNSNQQQAEPIVPSRVSILVETGGVGGDMSGGGGSSSSSATNGGSIGGLRVDDGAGRGAGEGMSPGSETMAMESDPVVVGPTAIPADEGDVSRPPPGAAAKGNAMAGGLGVAVAGGEEVETVTPREGDAAANGGDRDDEEEEDEEGENDDDDNQDDAADDESEYSYTYEDEDEGHYSGFLIPAGPFEAGNGGAAPSVPAAVGGGGVNVVASEDGGGAGGAAPPPPPRTISRAASRASDSGVGGGRPSSPSSAVPETNPHEGRKQKWREPTRAAVNMSLRAEKEKTGGRRRLASDLYKIMMADTVEAGFSLEPTDEDSMEKWRIKLFGFDEESNLAKDLLVCGMDHVELQMSFPDQYPFEPPFVRVVRPRFRKQTGFVMSGALCMELLTKDGWNPINDIESVIVSIRSLMVVGDGRLQVATDMGKEAYKKALEEMSKKKKAQQKEEGEEDDGDVKMGEAKRKRVPSDADEDADSKPKGSTTTRKATGGSYTASEAQSAYDHLSKYHKKEGWESPDGGAGRAEDQEVEGAIITLFLGEAQKMLDMNFSYLWYMGSLSFPLCF